MTTFRGPVLYVLVLVAAFAIAFGAGRAWGPQPEATVHDAPSHSVVDAPSRGVVDEREIDHPGDHTTGPGTLQHEGGHR